MIDRIEQVGVAIALGWFAQVEQCYSGPSWTLAAAHSALVRQTNVAVPWNDFKAAAELKGLKVVDRVYPLGECNPPKLEYPKGSPIRVHPVALFETSRESFDRLFGSLAPVAAKLSEPKPVARASKTKDKNGIRCEVKGQFNCGLCIADVAALLGVSEGRVHTCVKNQELTPFKKIGQQWVFELSELRIRVKRYRWQVATTSGELPNGPDAMPFITKYSTLFSN